MRLGGGREGEKGSEGVLEDVFGPGIDEDCCCCWIRDDGNVWYELEARGVDLRAAREAGAAKSGRERRVERDEAWDAWVGRSVAFIVTMRGGLSWWWRRRTRGAAVVGRYPTEFGGTLAVGRSPEFGRMVEFARRGTAGLWGGGPPAALRGERLV